MYAHENKHLREKVKKILKLLFHANKMLSEMKWPCFRLKRSKDFEEEKEGKEKISFSVSLTFFVFLHIL